MMRSDGSVGLIRTYEYSAERAAMALVWLLERAAQRSAPAEPPTPTPTPTTSESSGDS
jgi:hypothetical protein